MEQEKQSDVNIKQLEEISYKAGERMIEILEDKASINENINALGILAEIVISINYKFRLNKSS
jgi:hypothetical protein